MNRAPGRHERRRDPGEVTVRPRREIGLEQPEAALFQHVGGVVHECGLVQRHVHAVKQTERRRRVRECDIADHALVVVELVAIPAPARYPPGTCVDGQSELRELVGDHRGFIGCLLGHLVAQAYAVIMHAYAKDHAPLGRVGDEREREFVEVVANEAPLAPGLFPGAVRRVARNAVEREARHERGRLREAQAQRRRTHDLGVVELHAVARCPAGVERHVDDDAPIGRGDGFCMGHGGDNGQEHGDPPGPRLAARRPAPGAGRHQASPGPASPSRAGLRRGADWRRCLAGP